MCQPEYESIRTALQLAWSDYRHARDQTWKTVQIVAVLGAGLVTVDAQFGSVIATWIAGVLVLVAVGFGVFISIAQRKAERRKWIHIGNFERFLHLHSAELVPTAAGDPADTATYNEAKEGEIALPPVLAFPDAFNYKVQNTAVFILRMHLAIGLFALLVMVFRLCAWLSS